MLKYTTAQVTFREIPDEITLCINISNCPIHCPDCHSKELWENVGEELTQEKLWSLIEKNKGITCICIMGGDSDYNALQDIFTEICIYNIDHNTKIKTALYSGRHCVQEIINLCKNNFEWVSVLDYLKVGPYVKELGSLDCYTTNQVLYELNTDNSFPIAYIKTFNGDLNPCVFGDDITYKFWKNDTDIKKTRMEAK